MRLTQTASALFFVAVLAGCGSKASTTRSRTTPRPVPVNVTDATFRVNLLGKNEVPAGAPNGSAVAVISIHGKRTQLCWKFSALKHLAAPLVAHINADPAGKSGPIVLPLGNKFAATGCTGATRTLLATIEKTPRVYYVDIHNRRYPGGAVRAQL